MSLFICTPSETGESWRAGRVTCCIKDAATQHSTAMRHSVEFVHQVHSIVQSDDLIHQATTPNTPLPSMSSMPYMFAMRSDGGSDRNPKHASVQIASLHTFLRLDLDALIVLVTAADVSHVNEVEGVMPTVNLALQNQAFDRLLMSPSMETSFKSANSSKTIRDIMSNQMTDTDNAAHRLAWQQSMRQPLEMIGSRISQVNYTGQMLRMFDPAMDESLIAAFDFLKNKVDPQINPKCTTWKDVRDQNAALCEYLASHTRVDRYHLEFFKCGHIKCKVCLPVHMPALLLEELKQRPRLLPLPTPLPKENQTTRKSDDAVKYMDYDMIKYENTINIHRPSYKPPAFASEKAKSFDRTLSNASRPAHLSKNATLFHKSYVRHYVPCQDCGKRRVIYAWSIIGMNVASRLNELESYLSEPLYEYLCGDTLFGRVEDPEPHPPEVAVFHARNALTCSVPMETHYFSSGKFPSVCAHCGSDDDHVPSQEVESVMDGCKAYSICQDCFRVGKKPLCYGQKIKTGSINGNRKRGQNYVVMKPISKTKTNDDIFKIGKEKDLNFSFSDKFDGTNVGTKLVPRLSTSPFVPLQKVPLNLPACALVERMFGDKAEELFDVVNPRGDGNCGYYVVQLFNEHTGREEAISHNQFRNQLALWILQNEDAIITENDHARANGIGRHELERLRETVYQKNVNFERGCDRTKWWELDLFTIVAQMQKCNVVTFIAGNEGPNFIKWDGMNVVKTNTSHAAPASALPHPNTLDGQKNTIYCIFGHDHYIWLRPKPVTL